jgi:hypothetical protein
MRTGFRYALARGYDAVVQVDADGQHDPGEVNALLAGLDKADIVIGSRFAGKGVYQARGPRKYAMVALSLVFSRLARTKVTDVTSGFKAMGPQAIKLFACYYPAEYLGDTVESLVMAIRAKLKIREVPVVMLERAGGTPSHSPIMAELHSRDVSVALVRTDEFATWEDPVSWWPRLVDGVLDPVREGRPGRYRRMDWTSGFPRLGEFVTVEMPDVLVLEGVSSGRASIRPSLSYLCWVDSPDPAVRLERAVARDGEVSRLPLSGWQAFERGWFAVDKTRQHAGSHR